MIPETSHRKLAAIMFTDMVGYSALAQRNDKLALDLLEQHRLLLREIFPRFHGTEIKTIGDGFLVEFHSALEAVECAVEIQRVLFNRNENVPLERRIEIRIGVHIGDVVHRNGDVYGDGVNIASRIEPLAGPGGICVSMDVERQIRNTLDARFERLAPTELKNISIPMDLFRVILPWEKQTQIVAQREATSRGRRSTHLWTAIAVIVLLLIGVGWWWSDRTHRTPVSPAVTSVASGATEIPAKTIAVLPFENLSRDPDNAYFAAGIQDEIITRLSKISDLKVISCTSTQRFKTAPDDIPAIAAQLRVANVLEGSIQRTADAVRVNVQLIKAATNDHLWADTFDRRLTDIFAVETEIAKTIAETLRAKLSGSEQNAIAAKPTENTEAYQLYLRGRFFWNKRTGQNLNKAADYFSQAITADPNYALAYVGLADAYVLMPFYGAGAPRDCYPKAKAAAEKALELDNSLAEAHTSLAQVLCLNLELHPAVREFERAIELNPNYPTAHQWYGSSALTALGQFDKAIAEVKRAIELDPLSLVINADLGNTLYRARRYDDAIAQMRKTLEMDPGFYYAHWNLGSALAAKGALGPAIEEYQKARSLNDDPSMLGLLGRALAVSGNRTDTMKILEQLNTISKERYVPAYSFALVHLGLGDKDEALRYLEKAYEDRAGELLRYINVDPFLDPLRSDPRFKTLVEKIVPTQEFRTSSK